MFKKLPLRALLFILIWPLSVMAQSVDIPKPTRPGRNTIPQTQIVESSLPDIDEEIVRSASMAAMSPFGVLNPFTALSAQGNYLNPLSFWANNFSDFSGLTVFDPVLAESFGGPSVFTLPFMSASFPMSTSAGGATGSMRQAHFSGPMENAQSGLPALWPVLNYSTAQIPFPFFGGSQVPLTSAWFPSDSMWLGSNAWGWQAMPGPSSWSVPFSAPPAWSPYGNYPMPASFYPPPMVQPRQPSFNFFAPFML